MGTTSTTAQAIVICSSSHLQPCAPTAITCVNICGELVATSADSDICSSSNYTDARLHNNQCVQMPSACICNFTYLLTGMRCYLSLEMVQWSAARIVLQMQQGDRQLMSEVLTQLHWLLVKKRIEYKLLVVVHCALYEGTPVYLVLLLYHHTPGLSAGDLLLHVQPSNGTVAERCVRWPNTVERFTSHTTEHQESRTAQKDIKDIFIFKLTSTFYTK